MARDKNRKIFIPPPPRIDHDNILSKDLFVVPKPSIPPKSDAIKASFEQLEALTNAVAQTGTTANMAAEALNQLGTVWKNLDPEARKALKPAFFGMLYGGKVQIDTEAKAKRKWIDQFLCSWKLTEPDSERGYVKHWPPTKYKHLAPLLLGPRQIVILTNKQHVAETWLRVDLGFDNPRDANITYARRAGDLQDRGLWQAGTRPWLLVSPDLDEGQDVDSLQRRFNTTGNQNLRYRLRHPTPLLTVHDEPIGRITVLRYREDAEDSLSTYPATSIRSYLKEFGTDEGATLTIPTARDEDIAAGDFLRIQHDIGMSKGTDSRPFVITAVDRDKGVTFLDTTPWKGERVKKPKPPETEEETLDLTGELQ